MLQWKYLEKNSKEGYWDNQKKSVLPLMRSFLLAFLRDTILSRVNLLKIMIFITEKMNEKINFLVEPKEANKGEKMRAVLLDVSVL